MQEQWIAQLIKPGSSLGGARPKANVVDTQGDLWIAKFPSKHDEIDSGAWEMLAHDLAELCELDVPEAKLERFSSFGSTYLVKRFDRKVGRRIHLASAMTLLSKMDGASAVDGSSYLEIATCIRSYGSNVAHDLYELWRRIVFSMAISNTDDHLRNHAFLLNAKGWQLSPVYDVNPSPFGDELSLNIDETNNSISLGLAIESAHHFGVDKSTAEKQVQQICLTVKHNWERLAKSLGISRQQIEYMHPAFKATDQLKL